MHTFKDLKLRFLEFEISFYKKFPDQKLWTRRLQKQKLVQHPNNFTPKLMN